MNKNNTGEENTGDWNSGDWNPGYWNSGNWNSGDRNSGDWNSGDRNSGNRNSGNRNSGYRNSGNRNSGYWNSGDWNSGDWNSGFFNTDTPNVRIFNVQTDISFEDFNDKYNIYADIPLNRWINIKDIENPTPEQQQMGGYLKTLEYKEACQIWWNENPKRHKDFLELPHFNADIFKEITGIDVNNKEEIVEIDGKKWSKSTIKEALKNHLKD